jgi:hypothetical protein
MDLSPIDEAATLSPAAIAEWEQRTAAFYVDALLGRNDLDPPLEDPQVTVSLLFAARPGDDSTGSVLAMQYRATASFVSVSTEYDPGLLALPAFREQSAVLQYVVGLRQSGHDIYVNLMSLSLTVQEATAVDEPTSPPVAPDTPSPTGVPTLAPTATATAAPVVPATTPSPTRAPVVVDTPTTTTTTNAPSTRPPTFSLTAAPVVTAVPTEADNVVEEDTEAPTVAPTTTTTSSQEVSPPPSNNSNNNNNNDDLQTKYATTSLIFNSLPSQMEEGGPILDYWKTLTQSYLSDYIQALLQEGNEFTEEGDDDELQIEKVIQEELGTSVLAAAAASTNGGGSGVSGGSGSAGGRIRGRRQLQTNDASTQNVTQVVSLSLEFVSKVVLPQRYDANSLINGAFSTRGRREGYKNWILNNNNNNNNEEENGLSKKEEEAAQAFFRCCLTEILYVSDSTTEDDDDDDGGTGGEEPSSSSTGVIVGGIVGGLVVILAIVAGVYYNNNNKKSGKDLSSAGGADASDGDPASRGTRELSPGSIGGLGTKKGHSSPTNGTGTGPTGNTNTGGLTWEPAEQPSRLNQEIVVAPDTDDVSTIGDPYMYGTNRGVEEDDRTATTSVFQTETYNSLLGRSRMQHEPSFKSTADETEYSAVTGISKYNNNNNNGNTNGTTSTSPYHKKSSLLGELGVHDDNDETSFEQRLFPMDAMDNNMNALGAAGAGAGAGADGENQTMDEEISLDYSLPTALM